LCTAADPSYAEPVKNGPSYTQEDIINEIKNALKKRGAHSIRKLGREFKIMD
jgi:hypothetical protein